MDVEVISDIVFAIRENENKLLDIYVPKKEIDKKCPVIVYIYGGAFFQGSKTSGSSVALELSRNGYIVVCISYSLTTFSNRLYAKIFIIFTSFFTLLGLYSNLIEKLLFTSLWLILSAIILIFILDRPSHKVMHPIHVSDCAASIKWTYDNIEKFHGDHNNISLMGHSAGGHLSALLSCNPIYLNRVGLSPLIIKSTICISGVYNDRSLKDTFIQRSLLYEVFGSNPQHHIDAFPIHSIRPESCPPLLLLVADSDCILRRHAQEFICMLQAGKVYAECRLIDNVDHINIISNWNNKNKVVLHTILNFLHKVNKARLDIDII